MRPIFALLLALLLLPTMLFCQSKSGTAAGTFLEIPVGARGISLGGAFVSLTNDATSLYWNASGIARLAKNEALVSHTNWIAGTSLDFAGLALPLGSFGTLGFSFTQLSMADMMVRTVELPEGTGEYFSASDLAIGVSYARVLSDRFSIGFTAKYIQESIWHEVAYAMAVDIGTTFRTDLFGGMTIGASLSNFGTSMKLAGRDARQFIRLDPTKQGTNGQIPADVEFDSWDLPLLFQIGVSATPVKSEDFALSVAVDALHPSDYVETVNAGAELAYRNFLFIRGGYSSIRDPNSEGGLSLGVGLTSALFSTTGLEVTFDYAYRDMGRLENIQVISVGVQF
ncbi:MAG: PorV/PorQ family protein [Bacteroidota bacterium]